MTLMLMVQTVNSCKVAKDQTASSQITTGTPVVFMKKLNISREVEGKQKFLSHKFLCMRYCVFLQSE